jgi:hypothetical protein
MSEKPGFLQTYEDRPVDPAHEAAAKLYRYEQQAIRIGREHVVAQRLAAAREAGLVAVLKVNDRGDSSAASGTEPPIQASYVELVETAHSSGNYADLEHITE